MGGCALANKNKLRKQKMWKDTDIVWSHREQDHGKGKSHVKVIQQVYRAISAGWNRAMEKNELIRPYVCHMINVKNSEEVTGRQRKIVISRGNIRKYK